MLHRLSFSLSSPFLSPFSCGSFVTVSGLVELGGGRAGEFGRLFLSPPGQFSPAGSRRSALAGFQPGFLLFSDPGLCVLRGS